MQTKQKRRDVTERELTPATEPVGAPRAPVSAANGGTGLLRQVHARRPDHAVQSTLQPTTIGGELRTGCR